MDVQNDLRLLKSGALHTDAQPMVPAARGFACAPPEPRSGLDVPGSPPAASSGDGAEGAAHRRARRRWRTAILSAATFDPYLRARQHRTDHWRPLALRFDAPRYHPIAAEPGGEGRAKAPAGPPPSAFGKARGPSAGGGGLRRGSMPHLHAGSNLGGLDRSEVRLLRAADAHVRIPPNLNAWLTDRANCAPDALHEGGRQRVLYTAKISLRFKDHILSQSPCAYPISCPFPVSVGQYAYDLWRVYTCQGCPAGFKAWDQPMLWHAKAYGTRCAARGGPEPCHPRAPRSPHPAPTPRNAHTRNCACRLPACPPADQRAYLHVYSNRIEVNQPSVRCPWGVLGCGSWNEDHVAVHYFDRGAFGFRRVPCASRFHCCCAWEPFGEVLGRQRCPCNGPLVDGKGTVRCGQWCCDHWLCATCCCHYHYPGAQPRTRYPCACGAAALRALNPRPKRACAPHTRPQAWRTRRRRRRLRRWRCRPSSTRSPSPSKNLTKGSTQSSPRATSASGARDPKALATARTGGARTTTTRTPTRAR